jgi:hypothetical protein
MGFWVPAFSHQLWAQALQVQLWLLLFVPPSAFMVFLPFFGGLIFDFDFRFSFFGSGF